MNLVNKEDYITCGLYLLNKRFHTAFKLTSELRASDKGGKVEHIKLLALKSEGNIAVRQLLSYAFCNSGFTDTGFAYYAGVVLCTAG